MKSHNSKIKGTNVYDLFLRWIFQRTIIYSLWSLCEHSNLLFVSLVDLVIELRLRIFTAHFQRRRCLFFMRWVTTTSGDAFSFTRLANRRVFWFLFIARSSSRNSWTALTPATASVMISRRVALSIRISLDSCPWFISSVLSSSSLLCSFASASSSSPPDLSLCSFLETNVEWQFDIPTTITSTSTELYFLLSRPSSYISILVIKYIRPIGVLWQVVSFPTKKQWRRARMQPIPMVSVLEYESKTRPPEEDSRFKSSESNLLGFSIILYSDLGPFLFSLCFKKGTLSLADCRRDPEQLIMLNLESKLGWNPAGCCLGPFAVNWNTVITWSKTVTSRLGTVDSS